MKSQIVLSVNIGQSQKIQVGHSRIDTGIYKNPIDQAVFISKMGIQEDTIGDPERHGGVDQAVYIYSAEDYAWWEKELNRPLPFGTFGENLTLSIFDFETVKIGDRFKINDVLLEITFGRVPCAIFGARMGDPKFVKRFVGAGRSGVYTRVIQTGTVKTGDPVEYVTTTEKYPRVKALYDLFHSREKDPDLLQRGLASPIAERARGAFKHWLQAE